MSTPYSCIIKRLALLCLTLCVVPMCPATISRVEARMRDEERSQDVAPIPPASQRALQEMEARLRQQNQLSTAEGGNSLLHIAHDYYRQGDYAKSQALFQEILALPAASLPGRVDAARMMGQIALARHDPTNAVQCYERMIELSAQLTPQHRPAALGEAYGKMAMAYQQMGKYDLAIQARTRLIEQGAVKQPRKNNALLENARDMVRMEEYDRAVQVFSELIEKAPGVRDGSGRIVNLEIERVMAHGYPHIDERKLQLLEQLWRKEEYTNHLEIYNVGRMAVFQADQLAQYEKLEQLALDFIKRIHKHFDTIAQGEIAKFALDEAYAQVIVTLATHYIRNDNGYLALALYEDLLKRFPKGVFVDYIKQEVEQRQKELGIDYLAWVREVEFNEPSTPNIGHTEINNIISASATGYGEGGTKTAGSGHAQDNGGTHRVLAETGNSEKSFAVVWSGLILLGMVVLATTSLPRVLRSLKK